MSDIEDGEILSDCEEDNEIQETIRNSNPIDVYNVTARPERPQPCENTGHRGAVSQGYSDDDTESDSSSGSDDDSPIAKKVSRTGGPFQQSNNKGGYKKDPHWIARAHEAVTSQKGKKVNNIWGSVIQEEDMSKFVNRLNRNDAVSYEERGAESYDYTQAKNFPRFNEDISSEDSSESEEDEGPADLTAKETFGFVIDKPKKRNVKDRLGSKSKGGRSDGGSCSDSSSQDGQSKKPNIKSRLGEKMEDGQSDEVKQDVKSRLGERMDDINNGEEGDDKPNNRKKKPRRKKIRSMLRKLEADMGMEVDVKPKDNRKNFSDNKSMQNRGKKRTFNNRHGKKRDLDDGVEVKEMKHVEINEAMDDMELIDTVLDALREPQEQTDLFLKILDQLGREKVMKLFKATEDIEDMGGLMIQNGSRRRTPGGVFLLLVRKDADVTKEQIDAIFADQNNEYVRKLKEQKKERRKLTRRLKREEMSKKQKAALSSMDTGESARDKATNGVETTVEKTFQSEAKPEEADLGTEDLIDIQLE